MGSIRLRIGLGVFGVIVGLLIAEAAWILSRSRAAALESVDRFLRAELGEVEVLLGTPHLQALIDSEMEEQHDSDEMFFEVRDAAGTVVAVSPNVPPSGLGGSPRDLPSGVRIWERPHPSPKAHWGIRVVEEQIGGATVRVARSLESLEARHQLLKLQFGYGILAISLLGAGAAWLVAARALAPVRAIAARARELGASLEGELPRTGSGDELDELAEMLNGMLRTIAEDVERTRRMSADVGHALRTPLTAIRGELELRLARSTGEEADALAGMMEEVDQLIRNVNRLLRLEKLEMSAPALDALPRVELSDLTATIVEHLQVLAKEKGIEIATSSSPAWIRGDRAQLNEAIANLLANALHHTPRGGRVEVTTGLVDGRARLTVSDTGPGLTSTDLEHVFDRFYSTRAGEGGTGLGLPIARAVARAHGGDVRAASQPGARSEESRRGARFELELPAVEPATG